jgi:hypothetical protein
MLFDDNDQAFRDYVRPSNLYMIVQRTDALFTDIEFDGEDKSLRALLRKEGHEASPFSIDCNILSARHGVLMDELELEVEDGGETPAIKIWKKGVRDGEPLEWYTVDKILFDRWRGCPEIQGLDNFRDLTKYLLHYVGISKEEDSFTRLIERPHDARTRILSKAHPITPGARVTDELVHLLFTIEHLGVHFVEGEDDAAPHSVDRLRTIADAEKAFIRIMQSKHNKTRYKKYPQGADGLYGQSLDSYSYAIDEPITLVTETQELRGDHPVLHTRRLHEVIYVVGDEVRLVTLDPTSPVAAGATIAPASGSPTVGSPPPAAGSPPAAPTAESPAEGSPARRAGERDAAGAAGAVDEGGFNGTNGG